MTEFKKGREKNIVEGQGKIERSNEGLGAAKSVNRPSGFLSGLLNFFSPRKEEKEAVAELAKEVVEDLAEDLGVELPKKGDHNYEEK